MEKAATLNLRVNSTVKEMAEEILSRLGVPMSTAINMYLNQIILTGGIPFHIGLPKAPDSVNADLMSKEEIIKRLKKVQNLDLKCCNALGMCPVLVLLLLSGCTA